MAKKSAIYRDINRRKLIQKYQKKRQELKAKANDPKTDDQEKFRIRIKLAELPRNSSPVRARNRCLITGRPRGYYRKLKLSRIALRELATQGQIPGMTKSSW